MGDWSMDDWQFMERQNVSDPSGRLWSVALMDVLGQKGDPEVPGKLLELQYASGRYFTLIYSATGAVQFERGYRSLPEARGAYQRLVASVAGGHLDPAQPVYRENLED